MRHVLAAPIRSPRRAVAVWRALPLSAALLAGLPGPSVAVPLATCAPLEGAVGQPGCDWASPAAEGGRGSFAAGLRAEPVAAATVSAAGVEEPGSEVPGEGEAPVGALVALASLAAVLSLNLRRAAG